MRKTIVIVVVFLMLFCQVVAPARAVLPLLAIPPLIAGGSLTFEGACAVSMAVHGGVMAYLFRDKLFSGSKKTTIAPAGPTQADIAKPVDVVWFDLNADGSPGVAVAEINAKVKYQDMVSHVVAEPLKYPLLDVACHKASATEYLNASSAVGQVVKVSGHPSTSYYSVTSKYVENPYRCTNPGEAYDSGSTYRMDIIDTANAAACSPWNVPAIRQYLFGYASTNAPPLVEKTKNELVTDGVLSNLATNEVKDIYKPEIEKLMLDNPNIVHYDDTPDPLVSANGGAPELDTPFLSDADITALQNKKKAYDASKASGDSYGSYSTARNIIQQRIIASPGDLSLQQQLADAQAREAQAKKDLLDAQQAAADRAQEEDVTVPVLGVENVYDTSLVAPEKKDISSFLSSSLTNSPFAGFIRSLSISTSGQTALVEIPGLIYGRTLFFDFSRWEAYLRGIGTLLYMITGAYVIFFVMKGGK